MDIEGEIEDILSNLSVDILETKLLGGKISATVNMYLDLEAPDPSFRQTILDAMHAIIFKTDHFGTGKYLAGWTCHHCRGIDHPHGMCPYGLLQGWTDVTKPPTLANANANMSQNGTQWNNPQNTRHQSSGSSHTQRGPPRGSGRGNGGNGGGPRQGYGQGPRGGHAKGRGRNYNGWN